MIAQTYLDMLNGKSVIRQLAEWSAARGAEIGYQNVFDYSLGNPSVPCPPQFTESMVRLLQTQEPVALHGYSPTLTIPAVRAAVAENLNRRFGMAYTAGHIFMTTGAAGAIAHALRCVAVPGQQVLTFAPYFPEYKPYAEGAGLTLRVVPPRVQDFQIDFEAFEAMLGENTAAVLINTPNNPSGIAYSPETLRRLADTLRAASARYGHHIFLISDEPYREIVFGGAPQQHPAAYYDDTLTCYSFSKSLSLPGERIGYVAANPRCERAADIVPLCGQISRGTGHNCPASIIRPFGRRAQYAAAVRRTAQAWLYGGAPGRHVLHLPAGAGGRFGRLLPQGPGLRPGAGARRYLRLPRLLPHGLLHRYRKGPAQLCRAGTLCA